MIKKGQVSTEYLIILAVVLVIALVVVFLISSSGGGANAALETQSKNAWAGAAPFSVTSYSASGTALTATMKNNDISALTITAITGNELTTFATSTAFNPGEEKSIAITLSSACGSSGSKFTLHNITITYTKGSASGLKQLGPRDLVGTCG